MSMTSVKTTTGGVAGIVLAIAAVAQAFANTPGEGVDWEVIGPAVTAALAAMASGFGNLFARDNDVTSEEAGARPTVSKR